MHLLDDSKMNNAARATRSSVFRSKVKTLDIRFPVVEAQLRQIARKVHKNRACIVLHAYRVCSIATLRLGLRAPLAPHNNIYCLQSQMSPLINGDASVPFSDIYSCKFRMQTQARECRLCTTCLFRGVVY